MDKGFFLILFLFDYKYHLHVLFDYKYHLMPFSLSCHSRLKSYWLPLYTKESFDSDRKEMSTLCSFSS